MKSNRQGKVSSKKPSPTAAKPLAKQNRPTPSTPKRQFSTTTTTSDVDLFDAPAIVRYVPNKASTSAPIPQSQNTNHHYKSLIDHRRQKVGLFLRHSDAAVTPTNPLTQSHRLMGTPAGDAHHLVKRRNEKLDKQIRGNAGPISNNQTNDPNLLQPNALEPVSSASFGSDSISSASFGANTNTLSSAAFAATSLTDSTLQIGSHKTTKLPSASMVNLDNDLLQYIDGKSWLPARKLDDALPRGLPQQVQQNIRDFQARLPAPVHVDTASILALPKELGGFGFKNLTFIQGRLLPMIASGLDILLRAPTSSGKTLAYAVPLIEKLIYSRHAHNSRQIPIIVLVPSRELALQTTATVKHLLSLHRREQSRRYGAFALIGGSSVMRVEQEPLQRTDIGFLICTTQRLLDHIDNTPGFKDRLKECKTVVLDEVDYLLAQTGGKDIGRILEVLHPQRQTIMMSATLTPAVRKVASFALRKGACVVDVVKDSIVSLGTGIVTALSGQEKTPDDDSLKDVLGQAKEDDEVNTTENRVGKFDLDELDLLTKRQQELVGHFVNQDGERVHLDHSEVVDKLGTGKLVYENQRFKRLQAEEDEELMRLEAEEDTNEKVRGEDMEMDEFELVTEIDPITNVKTLKRVLKRKKPNTSSSHDDIESSMNAKVTLQTGDQDLLKQAGFVQVDADFDQANEVGFKKLQKLKGNLYGSTALSSASEENSQEGAEARHLEGQTETPLGQNGSDQEGQGSRSSTDFDFITQIRQKLTQTNTNDHTTTTPATTPAASALLKNSRKNELNDGSEMNQVQSDTQQSVSTSGSFNINDHLAQARKNLNQADVGPIDALMTQNQDIVDELALYSDEEDDPNLVVFDEVNHNVQHYVQAASTRDSLDIISRLFDDIGGRFIYAKEQVRIHNERTINDPQYSQYGSQELSPPKPPKIMVFCETARYAQYLAALFREVIQLDKDNAFESIMEIHSKKGQNYRTRVAQQFSSQNWNAGCILFSSDVAARGLDTQDVDCVIQLGLPPSRQQWVHRVGRVARDGDQSGLSLTLVSPQHAAQFSRMTNGLPIHVPKVGALGLGLKQDSFNNSVVDPLEKKKLGYSPMVPSQFGQIGDYFDEDGPGLLSGQLQIEGALHGDMDEIKKIVAGETKDDAPKLISNNNNNTHSRSHSIPKPHKSLEHQSQYGNQSTTAQNEEQQPDLVVDNEPLSVFEAINPVQLRSRKPVKILPKQEPITNPDDIEPEFDQDGNQPNHAPSHMSLFDELRQENGDLLDNNTNDFYFNRESFSMGLNSHHQQQQQHQQFQPRSRLGSNQHQNDHFDHDEFNPDFDAEGSDDFDANFDDNSDGHDEHGLVVQESDHENGGAEETQEQSLWHGTIERAVSTVYVGRIKDQLDKSSRFHALNQLTMSSNTGQVSSTEPAARYDFILDHVLSTKILRSEELLLNAERAYVAYLGHHIDLFHRSSGVEEKLKMVKISKTPFKNKDQVAKLALDFAKGIGLCGPKGDKPPPAISPATAQRLGFNPHGTHEFLNIGVPTVFSHVVELHQKNAEKAAVEQQRDDHRVRRKYWDAKQAALQQGKPIPPPPAELIEQRERIKLQKEQTAIARLERQKRNEEERRIKVLAKRDPHGAEKFADFVGDGKGFMDIHTALPGTLRTATPHTRKTTMIDFSDDEDLTPMQRKQERVDQKNAQRRLQQQQQQQAQRQLQLGSATATSLQGDFNGNLDFSDDQLDEKMSRFFPNNPKPAPHQRGMHYGDHPNDPNYKEVQEGRRQQAEKQAKRDQRQRDQEEQHMRERGKHTSSKFFEEHQAWVKQQDHKKAMRDRLNTKQLEEDAKIQAKYDKEMKRAQERPKREPAPGRELLKKGSLYAKEPRRIRTGELDHKVHLDIVL